MRWVASSALVLLVLGPDQNVRDEWLIAPSAVAIAGYLLLFVAIGADVAAGAWDGALAPSLSVTPLAEGAAASLAGSF